MNRRASLALIAAVALGLLVGIGAFTFTYARGASYLTNDPAACANCHVMQEHFDAWNKSSHRAVATCNDCHTPHNLVSKYITKANNGFWHSFYFTTGNYPDPLRITPRNHRVTEATCRYCHEAIVDVIDPRMARRDGSRTPVSVASLAGVPSTPKSAPHVSTNDNALSCVRCHQYVGHWVR